MMKIFSFALLLLAACSPPATSAESQPIASPKISEQAACTGTWHNFPNGCRDYCYTGKEPRMCTMAFGPGCDCGADQCFDLTQNKCVDNPK